MSPACLACLKRLRKKLAEKKRLRDEELENGEGSLSNSQYLHGWVEALEWAGLQLKEVGDALES